MGPIKFGLIGIGRIGRIHAQNLASNPAAQLVGLSDPDTSACEQLADRYQCQIMTAEDMINGVDIDAIIIASPTPTHADLIDQIAPMGKAIFCEKPYDLNVERIKKSIAAISKYQAKVMLAFNRRFDPNVREIKQKLSQGAIGKIEMISIISKDPAPPPIDYIKSSGGLFRDMMIHDFDMARYMLGEEFKSICAVGEALFNPAIGAAGDVDSAAVIMQSKSGKICQISCSRHTSYGYDQRIEIHGERGMLKLNNIRESSVEYAHDGMVKTAPAQHFFLERYAQAYQNELNDFIQSIQTGGDVSPSAYDGLQAQILADCAAQSLEKGVAISLT